MHPTISSILSIESVGEGDPLLVNFNEDTGVLLYFNRSNFCNAMKRWSSNSSVENIAHLFASDTDCANNKTIRPICDRGKCVSEPDIGYSVNYDDLCGPWSFRDNPIHVRNDSPLTPRLCVWQFLTPQNMACIKRSLEDESAIKLLLENKLRDSSTLVSGDIFLELALSIIIFARDNRFTEECTSALAGIFHLTYSFFLSNPWRTAKETYGFFYETILLHTVQDPPRSLEIFTPEECRLALEFLSTILMNHLPLVRFVSLPNYHCIASNAMTEAGSKK